jgi:hypothetical protein
VRGLRGCKGTRLVREFWLGVWRGVAAGEHEVWTLIYVNTRTKAPKTKSYSK